MNNFGQKLITRALTYRSDREPLCDLAQNVSFHCRCAESGAIREQAVSSIGTKLIMLLNVDLVTDLNQEA